MILYTAGNMNPQVLAGMAERTGALNWLETNAHKGSRDCADYFASWECQHLGMRLFIDSGAFTAWVKGKPIDHDAYILYCKQLGQTAKENGVPVVFAALDVIPGNFAEMVKAGQDAAKKGLSTEERHAVMDLAEPSEEEFRRAAEQGWKNYLREKANGLTTIPTFHQGDPFDILEEMLKDTDYIGLSPRKVNKTTQQKGQWLCDVFKFIDQKGKLPKPGNMANAVKTHGLGVSSPVFMETYPFYSVDSTRWLQGGNGYFFYFDGHRVQLVFSTDWGGLHVQKWRGKFIRGNNPPFFTPTSWTLSAIHHYRPPYQAKLVYYFHERGIRADAELNAHMTEHWLARGVDWGHDAN